MLNHSFNSPLEAYRSPSTVDFCWRRVWPDRIAVEIAIGAFKPLLCMSLGAVVAVVMVDLAEQEEGYGSL